MTADEKKELLRRHLKGLEVGMEDLKKRFASLEAHAKQIQKLIEG